MSDEANDDGVYVVDDWCGSDPGWVDEQERRGGSDLAAPGAPDDSWFIT